MALSESFYEPLVPSDQKASLASVSLKLCLFRHLEGSLLGVLLCCSACQAHRGAALLAGILLCRSAHQSLKESPWWGLTLEFSASGICWASISIVELPMLACGEKKAMVMASPLMCDSAVLPCFRGCLAFLHWHFPPQSPPSHPLNPSLHSEQQSSPWDCSTIPKLQLQATAPSRGPAFLSMVCTGATRTI